MIVNCHHGVIQFPKELSYDVDHIKDMAIFQVDFIEKGISFNRKKPRMSGKDLSGKASKDEIIIKNSSWGLYMIIHKGHKEALGMEHMWDDKRMSLKTKRDLMILKQLPKPKHLCETFRMDVVKATESPKSSPEVPRITRLRPKESDIHLALKKLVAERGEEQKAKVIIDEEINGLKNDVVWYIPDVRASPSHVFEIMKSSSIYKEIEKLRQANIIWGAKIYLVAVGGLSRAQEEKLQRAVDLRKKLKVLTDRDVERGEIPC